MKTKKEHKTKILPMIAAVITAVAAMLPSAVLAYGPERPTYTIQHPADKVTFNSITDNPAVGDERNFVRVAEAGGTFNGTGVKIEPGKEYEVYIYYHNNAKSSLNESGKGIARGVKVSTQYPTVVTPSQKGKVSAIISATNADPPEVWDEAYFTTDYSEVTLSYVPGSAKIYNSWGTNGSVLSDMIFTESGTYIGMNKLDGVLFGCAEYSGHIIYKLKAESTGSKVVKTVSTDGTNYSKNATVRPGDTVTYKVEFENTGTTNLSTVTFHDVMPAGLSLVPGTTYIYNNANPNGKQLSDLITQNGYDTGLYGPGNKATLTYKVKVDDNAKCGNYVNRIFVDHSGGEITDGATVKVDGCTEKPKDANAQISKMVSLNGKDFYESLDVKPGDVVTYRIEYENIGQADLNNVTIYDRMPENMVLLKDSTYIYNDANPNGEMLADLIDKNGFNIGTVKKGTKGRIIYRATVTGETYCGTQKNTAYLTYDGSGELSDGAEAKVNGNCTTPTSIPTTGPAEIALAAVILVAMGIGGTYFVRSRMELRKLTNK